MKPLEQSFGLESILTLLLPGLLVALGLEALTRPGANPIDALLGRGRATELLSALLVLAALTLLGAVVASIQAAIETWPLDRFTRWRLKLSEDVYREQWYRYLELLPHERNPYISRLVLFFQFETRLGLAGLFLGAVLTTTTLAGWAVCGTALFMYGMGVYHHYELGDFRKRKFG